MKREKYVKMERKVLREFFLRIKNKEKIFLEINY